MKLYLNDKPVDFELEKEKTLGEVYAAVTEWLYNRGFIITGAALNDEGEDGEGKVPLKGKELSNIPVEEVDSLKLQVRPSIEADYERLHTVRQYLATLHKAVENENTALIEDLLKDYPVIEEELDSMLKPRSEELRNSDVVLLSGVLKNRSLTDSAEGGPFRKQAGILLEGFISILDERIAEITGPFAELERIRERIGPIIEKLEEVPVQLQTGKDKDAMQSIVEFTELSQKIARIFPALQSRHETDASPLTIDGTSIKEFYGGLNEILNEITNAFASKDIVLIGDLLEYETAPRLRQLDDFIRNLDRG
jgi:hypothetical protein